MLDRPLHHGPTKGGSHEQSRFFAHYADTLASYAAAFDAPPPADLWPGAARRLLVDPQARRVRSRDYFIVPRGAVSLTRTALHMMQLGL